VLKISLVVLWSAFWTSPLQHVLSDLLALEHSFFLEKHLLDSLLLCYLVRLERFRFWNTPALDCIDSLFFFPGFLHPLKLLLLISLLSFSGRHYILRLTHVYRFLLLNFFILFDPVS